MEFKDMFLMMWPNYLLGILMFVAIYFSDYRHILRINFPTLLRWSAFLFAAATVKFLLIKYLMSNEQIQNISNTASIIPFPSLLLVGWEDLTYVVPLFIVCDLLKKVPNPIFNRILETVIFLAFYISFVSGHLYQGLPSALFIGSYILVSLNLGTKHGFGTMMIAHSLFDISTWITLHLLR